MEYRIRDMINTVEEDELYKLHADLAKGGMHLKKLVDSKIKELETKKSGYCVTCGKELNEKNSSFSLVFGSNSMRKKAAFCELDCLEYFIAELKKMREKKYKEAGKNELQGAYTNL
ncbi:MAG: hypothetical protein ACOCQX_04885 [Candidatus Nanoarchaeia archaeon]